MRNCLVLLLVIWLAAACAPEKSSVIIPTLPDAAREALLEQLSTPNLEITSAQLARQPEALRRSANELWCIISSLTTQAGANPISGYYVVFVVDGSWRASIADREDFAAAACANAVES